MADGGKVEKQTQAAARLADMIGAVRSIPDVDKRHKTVALHLAEAINDHCRDHDEAPFTEDQRVILVQALAALVEVQHNGKPKKGLAKLWQDYLSADIGVRAAIAIPVVPAMFVGLLWVLSLGHGLLAEHVESEISRRIQAAHEAYTPAGGLSSNQQQSQ